MDIQLSYWRGGETVTESLEIICLEYSSAASRDAFLLIPNSSMGIFFTLAGQRVCLSLPNLNFVHGIVDSFRIETENVWVKLFPVELIFRFGERPAGMHHPIASRFDRFIRVDTTEEET